MRRRSTLLAVLGLVLMLVAACGVASAPAPLGRSANASTAAAPSSPVAGIGGSARLPADVLDLRNWYLTLPTGQPGNPDTVHQPGLAGYSSTWFRLDDAKGGVVFTADAGGVTTKGSKYPRSELREMNGEAQASWSNTAGTHTLAVREAVTQLPSVKPDVVTAQIHDTNSDVVEVRLEGTRLIAQYDGGHTDVTLDPGYRLGTVYDLTIVASGGRIEVSYNGVRKAVIPQSGSGWYFKAGSYVQTNTSKGDPPDAVGVVVIYRLSVTHAL